MHRLKRMTLASVVVILGVAQPVWAQRWTIPEAIAHGAVGSVGGAPSGQLPTVAALLGNTDVVVMGRVASLEVIFPMISGTCIPTIASAIW
jgi:hypothetical protein